MTNYPCVPGHELAGVVTVVGGNVTKYKVGGDGVKIIKRSDPQVGDKVGVGCIVDSCMACSGCGGGEEQLCEKGEKRAGCLFIM